MGLAVFMEKMELKACILKTPWLIALFGPCAILRRATKHTHDISEQWLSALALPTEM
jgi:hypothetical protein